MAEQILKYAVQHEDGTRKGQSITVTLSDHGEHENEGMKGWQMHLDVNGHLFTQVVETGDHAHPATLVKSTVPAEKTIPAGSRLVIELSADGFVTISSEDA